MKIKIFLLFAIVVLAFSLLAPVHGWGKRSYKSILKDWTQKDEAYNWENLEARLVWTCTLESLSFRVAKVDRLTELFKFPEKKVTEVLREEEEAASKNDEVFCAIYVGSREHKFIGKDRSLWNLVLETSTGDVLEPIEWEETPRNQITQTLYPYIDRWSKTYKVKFQKVIGPETRWVQLKMVGIPADSTLEWNLAKLR